MQSVCSFSQSVSGSSPQTTQRPRSLPLRRGLSNSRRTKETLKLRSLVTGKPSSSSSSPSKGGGLPTSTSKKNRLNKEGEAGAATTTTTGAGAAATTSPSATDFVRVMRTLLFLTRPSSKSKASEEDKEAWKPRTSLDVSGHSFGKALKAELRRAKELHGHADLDSLSRDSSPFQAALRQKHLNQLRSPKGGFSGYKNWAEEDSKSDTMSRASFTSTSTLPPSPPPSRTPAKSALPPRCPPKGGGSRRSRQPCAVRERSTAKAVFASACPPAAEALV